MWVQRFKSFPARSQRMRFQRWKPLLLVLGLVGGLERILATSQTPSPTPSLAAHQDQLFAVIGDPQQAAYPVTDSLHAKVAFLAQAFTFAGEETALKLTEPLQTLGTIRRLKEGKFLADEVSVYAKLAKIRQSLEGVSTLYPSSYEKILARVQALLGTTTDALDAPTVFGTLNAMIAALQQNDDTMADAVAARWGTRDDLFEGRSLIPQLNTTLYALRLEPLVEPLLPPSENASTEGSGTAGGGSSATGGGESGAAGGGPDAGGESGAEGIRSLIQRISTALQAFAPDVAAHFGELRAPLPQEPLTPCSALVDVASWLKTFALFADEDAVGEVVRLFGDKTDGEEAPTLWGVLKRLESLCLNQPDGWKDQADALCRSISDAASGSEAGGLMVHVQDLQRPILRALQHCLDREEVVVGEASSCLVQLRRLKWALEKRKATEVLPFLETLMKKTEEIAQALHALPLPLAGIPAQFPLAVWTLWRQLYMTFERFPSCENGSEVVGTEMDTPTTRTLSGSVANLVQSFYTPTWMRCFGEVEHPEEGTFLATLQALSDIIAERAKANQPGYADLQAAPYFGNLALREFETPNTFVQHMVLLREALQQSYTLLDAEWGDFLTKHMGLSDEGSTNSLAGILNLLEAALEQDQVATCQQLVEAGNTLVRTLLFRLSQTVLPTYFRNIQSRLEKLSESNPNIIVTKNSEEDLAAFNFQVFAERLSDASQSYLPAFILELYELFGTTNSQNATSLFGVVQALEEGDSLGTALGISTDLLNPATWGKGQSLYGYENWLRAKFGLSPRDEVRSLMSAVGLKAESTVRAEFQLGWNLDQLASALQTLSADLEMLRTDLTALAAGSTPETTQTVLETLQATLSQLSVQFAKVVQNREEAIEDVVNNWAASGEGTDGVLEEEIHRHLPTLRTIQSVVENADQEVKRLLATPHALTTRLLRGVLLPPGSPTPSEDWVGKEALYLSTALRTVTDQLTKLTTCLADLKTDLNQVPFLSLPSSLTTLTARWDQTSEVMKQSIQGLSKQPVPTALADQEDDLWPDLLQALNDFQIASQVPEFGPLCCSGVAYRTAALADQLSRLAAALTRAFGVSAEEISEAIRTRRFDEMATQLVALSERMWQRTQALHASLLKFVGGSGCQVSLMEPFLVQTAADVDEAIQSLSTFAGTSSEAVETDLTRTYRCSDVTSEIQRVAEGLTAIQEALEREALAPLLQAQGVSGNPTLQQSLAAFGAVCQGFTALLPQMQHWPRLCLACNSEASSWISPLSAKFQGLEEMANRFQKALQNTNCCSKLATSLAETRHQLEEATPLFLTICQAFRLGSEGDLRRALQAVGQCGQSLAEVGGSVAFKLMQMLTNPGHDCCYAAEFEADLEAFRQTFAHLHDALKEKPGVEEEEEEEEAPDIPEEPAPSEPETGTTEEPAPSEPDLKADISDSLSGMVVCLEQWGESLREANRRTRVEIGRVAMTNASQVSEEFVALNKHLPRYLTQVANAETVVNGISSLLEAINAQRGDVCHATPSWSIVPPLKGVARQLQAIRTVLMPFKDNLHMASTRLMAQRIQQMLQSVETDWFVGMDDMVFYRHREQPRLFIRKNIKVGGFDDGRTPIQTDANGVILTGRFKGMKLQEFAPISLVQIIKNLAALSNTIEKDFNRFCHNFSGHTP